MTRIRRRSGHGDVRGDSGYMLLVLMLAVAVLTITMLSVVRDYKRGIQRDREVEMIHRGEQYERAIKRFYVKNNRYPVSLEQLENMNKIRYLRKRYKDPISADGEWKVVHPTDFKMTGSLASTTGAVAADPNAKADASQSAQDAENGTTGANQGGGTGSASGTSTGTGTGSESGSSAGASAFGNSGSNSASGTNTQSASGTASGTNNAANGQVLGGGDIYGVVSKSKKRGFHIYGEKEKYNEWFFVYDPSQDLIRAGALGRLLVGPYNPKMFMGSANSGLNSSKGTSSTNGIGGSPGTTNTSSGSSSGTTTTTQPSQ